MSEEKKTDLKVDLEWATDIVSAFVSHNSIAPNELPELVADVHSTLVNLSAGGVVAPVPRLEPAVPIKKSLTPDHIICLEDGKKFKTLKRYLMTAYSLTPDEYRAKWGLPPNYPMVAPRYAAVRAQVARNIHLGRKRSDHTTKA